MIVAIAGVQDINQKYRSNNRGNDLLGPLVAPGFEDRVEQFE